MRSALRISALASVVVAASGGTLGAALLTGCQRPPTAPAARAPGTPAAAAAPARAAALAAANATWPKVTGHSLRGETDIRFTAWFADGELRYLEEVAVRSGAAPLRGRYYFEHGALFYYSGESPPGAGTGGGATALGASVPVVAEFAGAQARQAVRIEHYGEVPLDAAALAELQRRAAVLAGLARDEWSAAGGR